jgi:tetratricopeptide (TPR) repeat protein
LVASLEALLAVAMRNCIFFVLLLAAAPVHADNRSVARDAYQEGTRLYDVGDFNDALTAFKKAYLNYEEPTFLFNMAQCYRQLGQKQEAVRMYRSYLRKVDDAPNRAEVSRIIASLESAIEQERATRSFPPQDTLSPNGHAPATGEAPAAQTSAATDNATTDNAGTKAASASTSGATASTTQDRPRPLYKRWWLWTAVGGAVAIGLGVGLGVGLTRNHFDTTLSGFGKSALEVRF